MFFKKKKVEIKNLKAMVSGKVKPIEEVKDEVFSQGVLGIGLAIEPDTETVLAPCDGEVTVVMDGSNHAVGVKVTDTIEILIHIGIDTVAMNGKGFNCLVKPGQKISEGEELIHFSKKDIEEAGYGTDVILVVMANDDLPAIRFNTGMSAVKGETVIAEW